MKNKASKIAAILLTVCMTFAIPTVSFAANDTAKAEEAKQGIVQVNTVYVDENDTEHVVCGGTGFLIGDEEGTEYVLTCNHLINPSEETKYAAFEYLGISNENDEWSKISLKTEVVVEGDVVLNTTTLNSSSELDFAVLQLPQPIYTRSPLTILTSEDYGTDALPYSIADKVYSLGFPSGVSYDSETSYYSYDQVSITSGSIVNMLSLNGIQTIEHDANVSTNNCGGPLVNGDGYVIGMNTLTTDGVYYCALDSTKIAKILDGLGVEYSKETTVIEEEETIEEVVETTESGSSSASVPTYLIIIVCVAIVAVIGGAVAIVIVLVLNKGKEKEPSEKKEKKKKKESKEPANNEAISRYVGGSAAEAQKPVRKENISCDTMVLGGGVGLAETNVLSSTKSASEQLKIGTLTRKKTGEKITLNKSYFTIGKDSLHVDYCIKDNGTISRQHAIIRLGQEGLYLEDCNSTNGTWLNGNKVSNGKAEILRNGDVIRISNEEFEYHA